MRFCLSGKVKNLRKKNEKKVLFVPLALLLILFTAFASGKKSGNPTAANSSGVSSAVGNGAGEKFV